MQIFALKLCLWLTERRSISDVKEALIRQQGSLQELELELLWTSRTSYGFQKDSSAEILLAVVTGLPGLKSLSLRDSSFTGGPCGTCELRSSLRRLSVGGRLPLGLERCMLEGSKASLVEVNVRRSAEQLLELLPLCPLLRAVTLQFEPSAKHLSSLAKVSNLRTVQVYCRDLTTMSYFLYSKPLLPWRLRLVCQGAVTNASPAVLERVRYLECVNFVGPNQWEWTELMDSLPNLEELHFNASVLTVCVPWESFLWQNVAAFWSQRTAPALREFHVHDTQGKWGSGLPELAQRLKRFLPRLRFCHGLDCPDKYPRAV